LDDRDITIADLRVKLSAMTDARYRSDMRLAKIFRFLEDFKQSLDDLLRAEGRW
jgi:hypothetical protein